MAETVLDRHIESTPGVRGGKPRIAGSRITVADIVLMHRRLGIAPEEIAGKYDLPLAAVYAAMSYYHDHKREIDQSIEEDEAFAESFRANNPSLLREKLEALSDEFDETERRSLWEYRQLTGLDVVDSLGDMLRYVLGIHIPAFGAKAVAEMVGERYAKSSKEKRRA